MARRLLPDKTMHGLSWPGDMHEIEIELKCYREFSTIDGTDSPSGLPQHEHMGRLFELLFPPPHYIWHKWTPYRILAWTGRLAPEDKRDYFTLLGPASTAKSTDVGACALIDWWSAMDKTRTVVCSTTLEMLDDRIWGEIVRLWNCGSEIMAKHGIWPGKMNARERQLTYETGRNPKAVLKGIAVQRYKSHQEALGRIIGAHMPFNRLIVDEKQAMPDDIIREACENLSASGEFKEGEMGNPYSPFDALCIQAEPLKGWDNYTPEMADDRGVLYFENKRGMTFFFDGRKSPGVDDPKAFPFMLTQKKINQTAAVHGIESPIFNQMRIGWPRGDVTGKTFITEKECSANNVTATPVWKTPPITCMAFDPAFASDGDRGIVLTFDVGVDNDDRTVLFFRNHYNQIKVNVASKQLPSAQIAESVRLELMRQKVPPERFAMDASSGTAVFADYVEKELGIQNVIFRVRSNEAPTELPLSSIDQTPANEIVSNRATELWMNGANFIKANMIRGLHPEIINELCMRRKDDSGQMRRIKAETKKDMRQRIGRSPDCFVAGTRILTPRGDIPIEALRVGDAVVTPFGVVPIVATHKKEVKSVHCADFSDGGTLIARGSHKVFTWDCGWVPLSSLLLTNKLEMSHHLWKWKLLRRLLIADGSIGFKKADTTARQSSTMVCRRSLCIASCGTTSAGLFRRAFTFIIKITIRLTTGLRIYNYLQRRSTSAITGKLSLRRWIQQAAEKALRRFWRVGDGGGSLQKQKSSCTRMESVPQQCAYQPKERVSSAAASSLPSSHMLVFAQTAATKRSSGVSTEKNAPALFAAPHSWFSNIKRREPVLLGVRELSLERPVEVYNLTLLDHNAYYANGVLVQNCADCFMIACAYVREIMGVFPGLTGIAKAITDKEEGVETTPDFDEDRAYTESPFLS